MTDEALLAGACELVRRVGKGGMGDVWLGRHARQDLPVAVKVLNRDALSGTDGFRMFRREVQAQARLHHPGVVRVHEYGEIPEGAAASVDRQVAPGQPFLVMQFTESGTLRESTPTNWPECQSLLRTILQALAHAHARGVVHRDLKPENILRFPDADPPGDWKLSDFGLAHAARRAIDGNSDKITSPEGGTPFYMSPEQFRGKWRQFGPWTDLYQIGCVTYELVTGSAPYRGDSLIEIAEGHLHEPVPELNPQFPVPDDLDQWVSRLLQPDREHRFRRAADAARALDAFDFETPESFDSPSSATGADGADTSSVAPTLQKTIPVTLPSAGARDPRHAPDSESSPNDGGTPVGDARLSHRTSKVDTGAFPETWRVDDRPQRDRRLADVGLGLFGLREVPFVDRDDERDRIWEALGSTLDDDTSRAVVVEGKAGIGKSRLAEWMAQRAHEAGVCTVLQAHHDRHGGPTTGLQGMIERWLGTGGLDRDHVWDIAQSKIATLARDDGQISGNRFIEDEARALTEFLRPSDDDSAEVDGPAYQFSSKAEQLFALRRVLRRLSRRRPLLVWIDDAQWGEDAVELANSIVDLDPGFPAVFLVTVRTDDLEADSQAARELTELTERDTTTRLPIASLSRDDQAELVGRLLQLEPDLAETVCRRTEGNPLFAVQLLDDWVSRNLLVPGDRGFRLVEGAETDVPGEIQDLWSRRLQAALATLPESDRDAALESLELAAALGRHVDWTEWRTACNGAGLLPPEQLVEDELVERGLVRQTSDGWKFVHSMFLETLRRSGHDRQRWQHHNRHCARTLETLYGDQGRDAERQARHWVEADDIDEALEPLLTAATFHQQRGDFEKEAELLEWRGDLLDQLGARENDRRRVENWTRRAQNFMRRGQRTDSESFASRARTVARSQSWPDLLGRAANVAAGLAYWEDNYQESLEILDEAEEAFRSAGDREGIAKCLRTRGINFQALQELEQARHLFVRARHEFESAGNTFGRLRSKSGLVWTFILGGEYRKAASVARDLVEEASDIRARGLEASAWNAFGDIARFRDNPSEAVERYQRAKRLWEAGGDRSALPAELNLAMAEFAASDYRSAQERFERLADTLLEAGMDLYVPHAYLGLAATAAARKSWPDFTTALSQFEDAFEELDYCDPDLVWLAERAGRHARRAKTTTPAKRTYQLAQRLARRLDPTARAEELRSRIESIDVDALDNGNESDPPPSQTETD